MTVFYPNSNGIIGIYIWAIILSDKEWYIRGKIADLQNYFPENSTIYRFIVRFNWIYSIIFISLNNSTESGWDNPFRPGGDLSREADEIVNMIKGKSFQPISFNKWITTDNVHKSFGVYSKEDKKK